jgi:hypothetical protein
MIDEELSGNADDYRVIDEDKKYAYRSAKQLVTEGIKRKKRRNPLWFQYLCSYLNIRCATCNCAEKEEDGDYIHCYLCGTTTPYRHKDDLCGYWW